MLEFLAIRHYMQYIVDFAQQLAQICFFRNSLTKEFQMFPNTKFLAVVHFLAELPAVNSGDARLLIDDYAGNQLLLTLPLNPGFIGIEQKAQRFQLSHNKFDNLLWVEIPGKGQVIAVTGIGNFPLRAPSPNPFIKVSKNNIDNSRRTGRSLGQDILMIAKHRQ